MDTIKLQPKSYKIVILEILTLFTIIALLFYTSQWYNMRIIIFNYNINIRILLIINIVSYLIMKYCQITKKTYDEFYIFLFWILNIISIGILYFGYFYISFNIHNISDYLIYWKYFSIKYEYSLEYKVKIFNNQLDYIMKIYDIKGQHLENIKLFIEQLNMKEFITEKTTIKDINMFIEDLLQNYSKILIRMLKKYERLKTTKAIMDCMSNIINSICLWSFATKYLGALYLVINPDSSEMRVLLRTLIILINRFK